MSFSLSFSLSLSLSLFLTLTLSLSLSLSLSLPFSLSLSPSLSLSLFLFFIIGRIAKIGPFLLFLLFASLQFIFFLKFSSSPFFSIVLSYMSANRIYVGRPRKRRVHREAFDRPPAFRREDPVFLVPSRVASLLSPPTLSSSSSSSSFTPRSRWSNSQRLIETY